MATLLTDLDATCANLGYHEPDRYYAEPDALQNLKVNSYKYCQLVFCIAKLYIFYLRK